MTERTDVCAGKYHGVCELLVCSIIEPVWASVAYP